MNDIKVEIANEDINTDRSKECIICMEDISENLIDNKYCDCKFKYHKNCYEKWLVYSNLSPINRERDNNFIVYNCILCKEGIQFDVKIDEWLNENSDKFKEMEEMRDMTRIVVRNQILRRRRTVRRAVERVRRRKCCVCEKYSYPFMINITCCYYVKIYTREDIQTMGIFLIVFLFIMVIILIIIMTFHPWMFK